ncbi:hypothetical protein J5N97_020748 [Dioscorea zingiberensis]|uniref:Uncharacterized protein n=1 Tax=Dioscorea zingiberensis TaxID=325984 RepID=A0A9D5CGZ6_9LILI|nr:hypothetical protein J5N97_020748 [Dioscorea zingiberensis]
MSNAWGGVGAWALDSERAEAEEQERAAAEAVNPVLAGQPAQSFPSLKEAVSTKPKKKKAAPMSLAVFNTGGYPGPGGGRRDALVEPKGLTHDEMLRLPTGPRERSADELEQGRLGGGFRSYGYGGGSRGGGGFSGGGRRPDEGDGRRGFGGGFDDEQRRGPAPGRGSDFDQPSRADEVDNWAAGKKSSPFGPPPGDSGRSDRYSMLGAGGSSRADDVDNWSAGKKPLPTRHSSFGSGFRDSSAAPSDSDRWIRGGGGSGGSGSGFSNNGDRPKLVLDPPKGSVGPAVEAPVKTRHNPFGAARPREEVLAEKGLDWRKMESDIEVKKTSRPTSSHSSRPSSAQSSRPGSPGSQTSAAGASTIAGTIKPRQKVNPFGDAKPREVLLEEKGKDWKKIDLELEHRRVNRPETQEEKMLKEELIHLKDTLMRESKGNSEGESAQTSAGELKSLHEQVLQRERELELLTHELDDKVRFGQKATMDMRPGSASGRTVPSFDRPPSQSGFSEESRVIDYAERPRSRGGMGDSWSKQVDDRQFQDMRERGFPGNRNLDRPKSRERW